MSRIHQIYVGAFECKCKRGSQIFGDLSRVEVESGQSVDSDHGNTIDYCIHVQRIS